jgi:hypothetical protein
VANRLRTDGDVTYATRLGHVSYHRLADDGGVRKLLMFVATILTGLLTTPILPATPTFASDAIVVPSVTIELSPNSPVSAVQTITTTQLGFSPRVTVSGVGAGLVADVSIKGTNVTNSVTCPAGGGGWSCPGELDPTGSIQISYFASNSAGNYPTGNFTVTVSMGNNGTTYTGTGEGTVTETPTDWSFDEAVEQLDPLSRFDLVSIAGIDSGAHSDVTMRITGLGIGPIVLNEGPCTVAGSSMTCTSTNLYLTVPSVKPVFAVQFVDESPNWRSLKITATLTPQNHVPDSNPSNNTVVIGPFADPTVSHTGGSTGSGTNTHPPAAAATMTASSSPTPEIGITPTATAVAQPEPTASGLLANTGNPLPPSGLNLASYAAVLAGVLLMGGAGATVMRRRRRGVPADPEPDAGQSNE